MNEFIDAIDLFVGIVRCLNQKQISLKSTLDEIVLKTCKDNLAYVDNRRDAKEKYAFDLWEGIGKQFKSQADFSSWIKTQELDEKMLYSKSEQFPDFIFKSKMQEKKLICGSLLELKDSKGSSIASFNSTLPTKYKSLSEIDIINGNNLVSKIVSIIDRPLTSSEGYYSWQRRNFYLIRTHKEDDSKVKLSVVDGSFFETVPKEHLIYQMFLNILHSHLSKKDVKMPPELLCEIEKTFSYITDQTIIAASQTIEKASVRPRLRIMAEVHTEGNPHSSVYPEILERSVNFIVKAIDCKDDIENLISQKITDVRTISIKHKRNGEHLVFQFKC